MTFLREYRNVCNWVLFLCLLVPRVLSRVLLLQPNHLHSLLEGI